MDSINKGCENKGMRFKIPCKKNQYPRFTGLILGLMLLLLSLAVPADTKSESDRSLFWSVQKNGRPAGYLLGTIHSELKVSRQTTCLQWNW